MLAIIAGRGRLPAFLAASAPQALICTMPGIEPEVGGRSADIAFRVERLIPFLDDLRSRGVSEVCFAGSADRPTLDVSAFDPATAAFSPRLKQAMLAGDDEALRLVLSLFEQHGLTIRGAHEIVPDLVPKAGVLGRVRPDAQACSDAERAVRTVAALGRADIGQGCVVQQGQVLSVETMPGTDWMLARLADAPFSSRPAPSGGKGLLYKAPKPQQDFRVDLPVIGPDTVAATRAAGLGGIAFEAGGVMVLDLPETIRSCDSAELFLWARAPA